MKLRKYIKEDSAIVCSWIKDEKSLYQWLADRIGKFPLLDDDLNNDYEPLISSDRFIPLSAIDGKDTVVGHLFIRYPNETDDRTVGFRSVGKSEIYKMAVGEWECIEMELSLKKSL